MPRSERQLRACRTCCWQTSERSANNLYVESLGDRPWVSSEAPRPDRSDPSKEKEVACFRHKRRTQSWRCLPAPFSAMEECFGNQPLPKSKTGPVDQTLPSSPLP